MVQFGTCTVPPRVQGLVFPDFTVEHFSCCCLNSFPKDHCAISFANPDWRESRELVVPATVFIVPLDYSGADESRPLRGRKKKIEEENM